MKSIGTYYSLGSLAYLTAIQAGQIDPNTILSIQDGASSGIIWNDDQTLCLMATNKFLDKRGGNSSAWTSKWSAVKKQNKIDRGKRTPRCEDTKAFWTNYCRNTIDSAHSGNEAEFLAQDPRAEQFLFRLSVHADLDNNFCIIPEGDYCLKENPGTYKLQKFVNSRGKLAFKFVPFDGVNPDYYFHFDDDNDLVYGNINEGYEKLLIPKNPRNSQKVKIAKSVSEENMTPRIEKKYTPISYTYQEPSVQPHPTYPDFCRYPGWAHGEGPLENENTWVEFSGSNCAELTNDLCWIECPSLTLWIKYPGDAEDLTKTVDGDPNSPYYMYQRDYNEYEEPYAHLFNSQGYLNQTLPYSGRTTELYYAAPDTIATTWDECRDTICPGIGGTFASITSEYEYYFLSNQNWLDSMKSSFFNNLSKGYFWLGAYSDVTTGGKQHWLYGSSSTDELVAYPGYAEWWGGQDWTIPTLYGYLGMRHENFIDREKTRAPWYVGYYDYPNDQRPGWPANHNLPMPFYVPTEMTCLCQRRTLS